MLFQMDWYQPQDPEVPVPRKGTPYGDWSPCSQTFQRHQVHPIAYSLISCWPLKHEFMHRAVWKLVWQGGISQGMIGSSKLRQVL